VALQLHRRLAVAEQAGRAAGALLGGGREEALLERLGVEQLLDLDAGLGPARIGEVEVGGGLLHVCWLHMRTAR